MNGASRVGKTVLILWLGMVLAQTVHAQDPVVKGNRGYIMGAPPQAQTKATKETSQMPAQEKHSTKVMKEGLGDVWNAIKKADAWVQENIW